MWKKVLSILPLGVWVVYGASWQINKDGPATNFDYMSNKSLAIESDNVTPHIVYKGDKLYHIYLSGTTWKSESISDEGNYTSVDIMPTNILYVSFSNNDDSRPIKLASNSNGWSIENVDANDGNYTSLNLFNGDADKAYITFIENGKIEITTNRDGNGWSHSDSNTQNASQIATAIDKNEKVHIAYYDSNTKDLNYTIFDQATGNFDSSNGAVDGDGSDVGMYPSVALDSANRPHISYYDESNTALKYAYFDGSWHLESIDTDYDVGKYSSIAIDYNDKAHISYYDSTHKTLKYATNERGSWEVSTIDLDDQVGTYTSIRVTPNGYAFISYYDANQSKIRVASKLVSIPKAPSNLVAVAEDNETVKLSWVDNSDNESNFKIYKQESGGSLSEFDTVGPNTTTYTVTGLKADTEYHFEVNASNDIGESAGVEKNVTTLKTIPKAPTNITFSDVNQTSVTIHWTDNSNNEEGFHIYRDGELNVTVNADTTSKQITGLTQNTTYTFVVGSYNNGGETNSSSSTVTTLKTKPAAPSNLSWEPLSSTSIKIVWKDNSDNEDNFTIYKDGSFLKSVNKDVNETTITGLDRDTSYDFNVSAQNNGGESNASLNNVRIADKLPDAPSNVEANTTGPYSIKIAWTDNSDNEDGFYIYRKEGSGDFIRLNNVLNANVTVYEDTGLKADTKYTYRVSAFNVVGENNSTNDDDNTTPPTPASDVTFSDIGTDTITIHWKDNSVTENNFTITLNGEYKDKKDGDTNKDQTESLTINSLSEDTNYTVIISAQNTGGESNVSAKTATLPKAPTNNNSQAISSTQIKLKWTNNSNTVTSFKIYRDGSLLVSGLSPTTTEYIDSKDLKAGTEYDYNITAVNLGGERNSSTITIETLNNVNPPSDLNYTALDSTRIKLTWKDNSNNEKYFYIYKDSQYLAKVDENTTTYIAENLSPNTTYLFEVMASNDDDNSTKARVIAKTPDVPPQAPSSLSASALSSTSIKLTWSDKSNNETGFKIYRNGTYLTTVGKDVTTFTDSGLSPKTSYTYQVKATNSVGDSAAISVTATTKDTVPAAPTNLRAIDVTSDSVTLTWSDNSHNESGFKIYKNGTSIATVGAGTTSYKVTGLSPNTSYNFEIRAYNDVGSSSGSTVLVTTKDVIPTKPSNLSAKALSATSIKLTWNDNSSNETGFRIYRDDNLIYVTGPNVESYIDTGLSPNRSYTYKVRAANSAGESDAVSVTVSTNDAPPLAPSNLTAIEAGSSSVKLSWVDNNEKGFKLYRNGTLIKTLPADTTTYTDTGLKKGTPYTYSISAYNDYGESSKISFGITLSSTPGEIIGTKEDFIERLYENFLGREADEDGLEHWKNQLESGKTALEVARDFFNSKEFKEKINPKLSDEEYITMLYETMLGRKPDIEGLRYWEDQLATKGKTRELIFYDFALSPEFYSISQHYGVQSFNSDDLLDNFLVRMYYLVMTREPDEKGLNWWKNQLKSGLKTAKDIATGFFDSPEFRRRGYSNYNFITIAYRALLNREPDMEGRDFWNKALEKGMSRHDMIMNFIASDEFKSLAVKYGIKY